MMMLIEIIWGGSLLAIMVMGCLYVASPAARRRLMSDKQERRDQRRVAKR